MLNFRVEVGHANRKLSRKVNCLLSIIPISGEILDFECFLYDSFQENRIFAENWAMGITYCIEQNKKRNNGMSNGSKIEFGLFSKRSSSSLF